MLSSTPFKNYQKFLSDRVRDSCVISYTMNASFLISLVRQGEALVQTVLDISTQKRAQLLLQQHSQKLTATNEELRTTNEELATANEELAGAKAALERLNAQLEERVVARTQELQRAHQEAQLHVDPHA